MKQAPNLSPGEELSRLEALYSYSILDTRPDPEFDTLTRLASAICETPIALISLVDKDRLWFKSRVGMPEGVNNIPRGQSFCRHTILSDEILEIRDTTKYPRSQDNPVVTGAPHLRFYAGAPLINSEGYRLGTLCVIDYAPKQLNPQQLDLLRTLSAFAMNLFELRRTKHRLEKNERLYHSLLENVGDIIYTSDAAGCFTYMNRRAEQMTGYTAEELIGKPYTSLVPDEWIGKVRAFYQGQQLNRVRETRFEFPIVTKSGNWKWVEQTVVATFEKGRIVGYHCVVRDVDQRKEMEKQTIAAKELAEQSARSKELFLASMSHEIRTPMNAVLGFTGLLKKTALSADQQEFVDAIDSSGRNLMAIINDILDYSKIEAGMMKLEKTDLSIRSAMSSLAVLFGKPAKEKNIALEFHADESLPEVVLGDPTRLTQIFINLVGNAIKFTPEGSIRVSARKIGVQDRTVHVQFEVSDTGIGIPEDKLGHIFERFSQATESTTRKYGGTGLGLSIVKSLVELQDGFISVQSEPHKGSTFTFILPFEFRSASTVAASDETQTSQPPLGPMHILVVEDNLINQKLAERVLSGFGFTTEIAGNGKIAIDMLKQDPGRFNLVLMDMQMPEMDGYSAAHHIRHQLGLHTPIFAMTAHALSGEKEKCLQLGMNDYIAKPFNEKELYAKIAALPKQPAPEKRAARISRRGRQDVKPDMTYVTRISGNNSRFIAELLDLFVRETPRELEQIRQAISERNYAIIRAASHKMKSNMQLVGLEKEFNPGLIRIEELASEEGSIATIGNIFGPLSVSCTAAVHEVQKIIPYYRRAS